jgi:hypothetical protein
VVTPLVNDIDNPLPQAFRPIGELVLNLHLRQQLTAEEPDLDLVRRMLQDARLWKIRLEEEQLGHVFSKALEVKMRSFLPRLEDTAMLDRLIAMVDLARSLPFYTSLHRLQSSYYSILKTRYGEFSGRTDEAGRIWLEKFRRLGEKLSVKLP